MEDFFIGVLATLVVCFLFFCGFGLGIKGSISTSDIKSHCISEGQFVYDDRCKQALKLEKI